MKKPMIRFQDFSFKYDAQEAPTLKHINLTVYEGEKLLIIGPSGSGKSSLANCINGLIPFAFSGETSGVLEVNGMDAARQSIFALSHCVGTVMQDLEAQFLGTTVGEDMAFLMENDAVPVALMRRRVAKAADLVGIADFLEHAPHELSGGQMQRTALGGVLNSKVKILLFDEPLASLDPATGAGAMELIDRVGKQTGATVLIIEHRLEDVLHCPVDRIILMANGEIVADHSPQEFLCSPLLEQYGIRPPLYLTAARKAGCAITPQMQPQNVRAFSLGSQTEKITRWFASAVRPAPPPPGRELLRIENLSFRYPKGGLALQDISLSVAAGEMVSLVGRNGAGKSTLAKLICGFEPAQQGKIEFGGEDITRQTIKRRAQKVGYVMQNPNQMICKRGVSEEVGFALALEGLPAAQISERVNAVLDVCGLYPFRNWPSSALSYGQRKRVTIASVLVQNPRMMILDEPTAGQDMRHYTEIMEFLCKLNQTGISIVLITHDMHLMLEYTRRSLVFSDGRLIGNARPADVLTNPVLIEDASLRRTSLFDLAEKCELPPLPFVEYFISSTGKEPAYV